jgi:hypothetical protein
VARFAIAGGLLLGISWALLTLFFVKQNETADLLSNYVALPALVAIGVTMGAVLDRFAGDAPVLVSLVTAAGLAAVTVNLAVVVLLVLKVVEFPRVAMAATAAWGVLFLWVGAVSVMIVAYGHVPRALGWFGIAVIAYTLALLAFVMRDPEVRKGTATPPAAVMVGGAPVLLLVPVWFVWLGICL